MPSPEMQELISELRRRREARAGQEPPPIEEVRAAFAPAVRLHPIADDVEVTEVAEAGAGGVPGYWLSAPGADPDHVLLYVHGGAYSLGSLRSHGELAARLGRAAGMRVFFPEYRLAPEHPFPAAVDDVRATWGWLRDEQGLPAESIALAGDSAGGGLVLALLTALRDAGARLPSAAVLLSPFTDLTASGASITERVAEDPLFTPDMIRGMAPGYLAGADPRAPLASPVFAEPNGFPPLLVLVGSAELLLSDSERLAAAATHAGVDVTLHLGEGLPHVYPIMLGTPEAAEATEEIAGFLRAHRR